MIPWVAATRSGPRFPIAGPIPRGFRAGFPVPALPEARYSQCLIGDLQHQGTMRTGQQEDAILVSDQGMQVFQISPNG